MAKAPKLPICEPLNFCIYCGTKVGNFTDEHIFPAALDGVSTLPKSTCQACQNLTSRFERTLLRGGMHLQRITQESFTRRPEKRQSHVRVKLNEYEIEIPVNEHPALLHLFLLPPPKIESKDPIFQPGIEIAGFDSVIRTSHVARIYNRYLKPQLTQKQKDTITKEGLAYKDRTDYGPFEVQSFVQVIAKIALCSSVAKFGQEVSSNNFLCPLILQGKSIFNYYIGSSLPKFDYLYQVISNDREPHRAYLAKENGYLVAYIQPYFNSRFLESHYSPTYKVIVSNFPS